ncbi:DUF881 domain-containing protein [Kitasatospora nipponensis]
MAKNEDGRAAEPVQGDAGAMDVAEPTDLAEPVAGRGSAVEAEAVADVEAGVEAVPGVEAVVAGEPDAGDEAGPGGDAPGEPPVPVKSGIPPEDAAEPLPEPAAAPAAESGAVPAAAPDGRRRLRNALWPPRVSRGQLVVALLLFALGLGLAIQVRSTNDHSALRGARQEDLVRILDELDARQQRLQQEKAQLDQSLTQLENSSNQAKEAEEQTRKKAEELGVLAGTVKASGPGIVLTVDDPQGQVKADMLLDTLQELRAAGAEAIQINDVRVVADTFFTDVSSGGVQIDGKRVSQPYRFTVIGNPQDLTPALNIPGGIVRTLEKEQVGAAISEQQKVTVDALATPGAPQFAKSAAQ